MITADAYRQLAAELLAKVTTAPVEMATQYTNLAQAYLRLAEQADRNSRADIWAEFGAPNRLDGEQA